LVIFDAVRGAFPPEKPVSVRVSGTDWVNGGWDVEQTIVFARKLEERGCDAIDVSSGVRAPKQYLRSQPRRLKDLFLESE
jgi:2,4-dienoyl-CoA reductase-like NADH-dependent reductase (Old Yellow Enzyme family)